MLIHVVRLLGDIMFETQDQYGPCTYCINVDLLSQVLSIKIFIFMAALQVEYP